MPQLQHTQKDHEHGDDIYTPQNEFCTFCHFSLLSPMMVVGTTRLHYCSARTSRHHAVEKVLRILGREIFMRTLPTKHVDSAIIKNTHSLQHAGGISYSSIPLIEHIQSTILKKQRSIVFLHYFCYTSCVWKQCLNKLYPSRLSRFCGHTTLNTLTLCATKKLSLSIRLTTAIFCTGNGLLNFTGKTKLRMSCGRCGK